MGESEPNGRPAYRGPDIPRPLGNQLQVALALENRPETFGDWVAEIAAVADRDDVEFGLEALCTADDSPHLATFGEETRRYQCVQDALIVPFLADEVDTVDVTTESPVSGTPISLTVTASAFEIDVDPSGAVMSFGVAADAEAPPSDVPSPILAYGRICPYGHAFVSRAEYEEWAAATDALTMATPMADALELARAFGRVA